MFCCIKPGLYITTTVPSNPQTSHVLSHARTHAHTRPNTRNFDHRPVHQVLTPRAMFILFVTCHKGGCMSGKCCESISSKTIWPIPFKFGTHVQQLGGQRWLENDNCRSKFKGHSPRSNLTSFFDFFVFQYFVQITIGLGPGGVPGCPYQKSEWSDQLLLCNNVFRDGRQFFCHFSDFQAFISHISFIPTEPKFGIYLENQPECLEC